jgi:serine phosphatase RsbU (regulator of sigma subunit)
MNYLVMTRMSCKWTTLLLIIWGCCGPWAYAQQATRGELDLTNWTPAESQTLTLAGEWAFYWDRILSPQQVAAQPGPDLYAPVPGAWSSYQINNNPLTGEGCATYALRIRMPSSGRAFSLHTPFIWTSHRIFVNGRQVMASGEVACDPETVLPQMIRTVIDLPPGQQEIQLVVQVSDYSGLGGDIGEFELGHPTHVHGRVDEANMFNLLVMGALLIMALYYLLLYYFRRKETGMLYFGLIAFAFVVRFAFFGDHYVYQWLNLHAPFFSFPVQLKGYYIPTVLLVLFGLRYLLALFPQEALRPAYLRILQYLLLGYCIVLLLMPGSLLPYVLPFGFVLMAPGIVYFLYVLVLALRRGRPYARLIALGIMLVVLAGLHDALLLLSGISIGTRTELVTYGFVCFLFLQIIVLGRRFSTAFNEVEDLSQNLEKKVIERTHELQEANEEIVAKNENLEAAYREIEEKNQDITDSIVYARRIQLSILPKDELLSQFLPDSFVFYQPKDIVSGDFYWFYYQQDELYICAADCTGHGVPGAFMSVMGSNMLTSVTQEALLPDTGPMLDRLNSLVREALNQDRGGRDTAQDGMDVALVRLNLKTRRLQYSGANRPLLYLRMGELNEIAPEKRPIGGGSQLYAAAEGGSASFTTHEIQLMPEDRIYLYTDGITDQFGGEARRKFTPPRLRRLLQEIHLQPMDAQKVRLKTELDTWMGALSQTDDMMVIGLRIPI